MAARCHRRSGRGRASTHPDGNQRWGNATTLRQSAQAKHTSFLPYSRALYYLCITYHSLQLPNLLIFRHLHLLGSNPNRVLLCLGASTSHVEVCHLGVEPGTRFPEGAETGGFRASIPVARGHADTLLCPAPSFSPFSSICSGFDKYSNLNPVIFETSAKISSDFDKFPSLSYIMYARARRSCGTSVHVLSGAFFLSILHTFAIFVRKNSKPLKLII